MATPPPRRGPGAGLAPLVDLLPSQVPGLAEPVRAALREIEADAAAYRKRGALLGWQAAMDAAWKLANGLKVDIDLGGPDDFKVSTT